MKKLLAFFLVTIFLTACNSVKRVKDNEHLLAKNIIIVNDKKVNNPALNELIVQKPNSKTLGIPLSLYFYNFGNPDKPKTASEWGKERRKTYNFIKNVFSEKQSIAYANTMIGFNNWFLRNGEATVSIEDKKTKKTVLNLSAYYKTKGYFKAKVSSKKDTIGNKKGIVTYNVITGNPIFLDTISHSISSPILDSIYKANIERTFLKKGDQYDEVNFRNEARRLTRLYRNSGVYHFNEAFIGYYDVDTTRVDYKTNVDVQISDRIVYKKGDVISLPLKAQKLRNINIFTDYSFVKKDSIIKDSISYNGLNFNAYKKIRYNPRLLAESIFIKPNQLYTDTLRNLTRQHLKSLKNFKTVNIQYAPIPGSDEELDVNINLTPIEKYTLGLETELTHSNIRDLGISGKFSIINRNTFKGAEIFKISFLGSFFNASQDANQSGNFFNSWEIGSDLSLEAPRLVAPFGLGKLVPKRMSPRTTFTLGSSIQRNIGLDRQTVTGLIDYKWQYNPRKTIQLEIFNTQYVRNLRVDTYFQIYNSEYQKLNEIARIYTNNPNLNLLQTGQTPVDLMNTIFADSNFQTSNPEEYRDNLNILDRYNIITSDFLIPTIAYSLTHNNQTNYTDNNFSFFKVRVANSGNIGSIISSKRNDNNRRTIFKIPLAQYFKVDLEYKKFWEIDDNSVFGVRSFVGAIIPYDNSDIPFTKSYFAGGSNDIRAWQTYDLGPGRRKSGLEYNIGSFKFLTSAEYRFDMFGSLKGALFIDAGNIWDITNSIFAEEDAKLNGFNSIQDIAVGSGFGLRYDFSFLVFRLDLGFKMHEPYLNGNKWFRNYNFSNTVYNIGINYPF